MIRANILYAERKGKTLHLLKSKSKAASFGRKRKRYEVFDPGMEVDVRMDEENKEAEADQKPEDGFVNVNDLLKRPKRNKTPVNNP